MLRRMWVRLTASQRGLLVVGLVIAAGLVVRALLPQQPPPAPTANPVEAWTLCKDRVRAGLKAPSSADFPAYDPASVSTSGAAVAAYRITSYVDADNGFGAHVRTPYQCSVQWDGSAWQVQSVAVG